MLELVATLLALSFDPAAPPEVCLPWSAGDGGSPVIAAIVNGRGPFHLVLDTAASGTTLDEAVIATLGLNRDVATEQAEGLGGPMSVRLFKAARIEAGPITLSDLTVPEIPAPVFDSHDVAGLAGVDLLAGRLTVWRPETRCVGLLPTGRTPPEASWSAIEATWLQPWKIMLPVRIGAVEGLALLDTGAQHTVLNPAYAAELGLTSASGRLRPGGEISGIDGRPMPLSEADAPEAAIGPWRWTSATVKIGDLPVFGRLGDPDAPLMVLGMDWLDGRGFAVDYEARRVWLRPAPETAPANPG